METCFPGSLGNKAQVGQPGSGVYGAPAAPVASQSSGSFAHSATATTTAPYSADTAADYGQRPCSSGTSTTRQPRLTLRRCCSPGRHGHRVQQGAPPGTSQLLPFLTHPERQPSNPPRWPTVVLISAFCWV
ncbi:unnamed protein product [Tetraodon nigroviridis]|uniref:(spotted green pufferfish) hypothetical protein n=1 Tax=Tetraodon nigroviridis TaxID=99883 RepID=Q4TFR5_TETNG|nr:unnamed protein product [Tetraodon nigroviridis]